MTPPHAPSPGSLLLVRHGQTEWARAGRHTGLTDVPLTPEGEAGAKALATLLDGRRFALVLSSPLQRARRTADLAGLTGVQVDHRLVEWDYGAYEGLTTAEIRERLGRPWNVFDDGVPSGDTPGETLEALAARTRAVLDRVRPALAEGDVVLVGHGHCLRVLATVWLRQEPRMAAQLILHAGSLSELGWERETPAIVSWNRTPEPPER
ncbi:MAG: histidine phosphatase family protein [Oryzihumus sp.]